jgi:hypothetical protein
VKHLQDQRIRQILAEMQLLMYGSTTAYNASGGSDMKQRDFGRPPGDSNPLHDEYRDRYLRAMTDDARERVISDARAALEGQRRQKSRPKGDLADQTLRERILEEGEGWPAVTVAQTLRCLERKVRQVRRDAGKDEDTGTEARPTVTRDQQTIEHAQELFDRGMTFRQIEQVTGLSRSTLHRKLRNAA